MDKQLLIKPCPIKSCRKSAGRIGRVATHRAWLLAVPAMLQVQCGSAWAQDIDLSQEPRDAAGSRAQPEYDPLGIHVGTATIYPTLSVSSVYDTNVFAESTDADSDLAFTVTPAVRAEISDARRIIAVNARARVRRYVQLTEQNDEQYYANALGRLNFGGRGYLQTNLGWSLSSPSRGTYQNSLQRGTPLREERLNGQVVADYRFNRLRLHGTVNTEKFDYDDVELDDGTIIDQDYRDGTQVGANLEAYYQVSSRISLVAQGSVDKFEYKDPDPLRNRDAVGTTVTAGALYEVTELFSFQLGVGYRKHDFDNPLLPDIDGLAFNGRMRWYPTPLISVKLDLNQSTDTSTLNEVSAVTVSSAVLETDYELRRNNILTARLEYSHERYSGLNENSAFMSASVRSEWKLNRWMRLAGSLTYDRRASGGSVAIPEFDALRGMLTVTLAR